MTRLRGFFLVLVVLTILSLPSPPRLIDASLPPLHLALERIVVVDQRPDIPGYARERFGGGDWAPTHGQCTVREDVLAASWSVPLEPGSCRVGAGGGLDLYSGAQVAAAQAEIDHVFPLSAAWDLGAAGWDEATRARFANDPVNLVPVSREENRAKSDLLPASWLPSDRGARCWYSRRLAVVAVRYGLALPAADVSTMRRTCLIRELPALLLG